MNIKLFEEFILEKKINKILYHGSPYFFEKFNNEMTFFSDTAKFAEEYAIQKSQESQLDADIKLYECKISCNIFDINDIKDFQKIKNNLPKKTTIYLSDFPFPYDIDKDELLLGLQGYTIIKPFQDALNANIGDVISTPEYKHDQYKVYKKDSNYVYTYNLKTYNMIIGDIFKNKYDIKSSISYKYNDIFNSVKNFVKEIIKKNNNNSYISDRDMILYSIVLSGGSNIYDLNITDEDKQQFKKIFEENKQHLIEALVNNNHIKKFNLNPIKEKLIDNWRYYENETIINIIKNLGYGGYVAKEKNINTYAIFNPNECVNIIKYYLPYGIFNNINEIKKFLNYDKTISNNIKNRENWYRLDRYFIYDMFIKNIPIKKAIEEIKSILEK